MGNNTGYINDSFKLGITNTYSAQGYSMYNNYGGCVPCPVPVICQPVCYTYSSAEGSASTVANATGKKLRIFYHKEKLNLEDFLYSETTKKIFKPKAEMVFINLAPKHYLKGPSVAEGFASIFVEDPEDGEVYVETIALNFEVLNGACCIVTASNEVKFRKPDGGIWIDEDDHDHNPDPVSGS